jgi:hypothetical protein
MSDFENAIQQCLERQLVTFRQIWRNVMT